MYKKNHRYANLLIKKNKKSHVLWNIRNIQKVVMTIILHSTWKPVYVSAFNTTIVEKYHANYCKINSPALATNETIAPTFTNSLSKTDRNKWIVLPPQHKPTCNLDHPTCQNEASLTLSALPALKKRERAIGSK